MTRCSGGSLPVGQRCQPDNASGRGPVSRIAIVTGGTRGIGKAISLALQDMGYSVAANYAGNVEKAKAFTDATGIAAYQWDVGDHRASLDGCAQVAADLGP